MSFQLPEIAKTAERLLLEIEQAVRRFPQHEHAADAVLALENRARYLAQSKATRDGGRADPPPRDPACPLPRFRPAGRFVIHGED